MRRPPHDRRRRAGGVSPLMTASCQRKDAVIRGLTPPARLTAVLALALGLCALARADETPPIFVVRTADGKSIEGRLREIGPDWSVHLGDAAVDGGDVLTVRRAGPLPPPSTEAQLLLAGGDSIPVKQEAKAGPRLVGDRIHFVCPVLAGGQDASVPLSAVSVIWYGGTAADQSERLRRRLVQATRKRDQVLLKNGDALDGVLTALDAAAVTIEVDRRPVTIGIDRAAAVALSSDLTEAPKPQGVYARVVLDGPGEAAGARLSLASARSGGGATLTGETLFGAAFRAPLANTAALDLLGGKAVYLSELKPARYEYFPYLDDRWEWSRDADVTGLDLRLGGSTYDRGVGLHSHARLTYAVPKDCRRFEALVGLDDRTGREGSVRVPRAGGRQAARPGRRPRADGRCPAVHSRGHGRRQGMDAGSGLRPGRPGARPRRLGGRPLRQVTPFFRGRSHEPLLPRGEIHRRDFRTTATFRAGPRSNSGAGGRYTTRPG